MEVVRNISGENISHNGQVNIRNGLSLKWRQNREEMHILH